MAGHIEGSPHLPVTLHIFDNRRQRLLGGLPRAGDVVGCAHMCHSVYEPKLLFLQEEFQQMLYLRRRLPYDIIESLMPELRRPLLRVDV